MQVEPQIYISKEDIVPYIKEQGVELMRQIAEAKKKYGQRYNDRNSFEQMLSRFGDPVTDPEKFAGEYVLVSQKKSRLPAAVRNPLRHLCEVAANRCYRDKLESLRVDFSKAQDGDVMLGNEGIFIYKETGKDGRIVFHAMLSLSDGKLVIGPSAGAGRTDRGAIYYNACKPQVEALMNKIAESGYQWDEAGNKFVKSETKEG